MPDRFTDIGHLSEEAKQDIKYAVEHGLVRGTSDTTFTPEQALSRWQAAILLARIHRRLRAYPELFLHKVSPGIVMLVDDQTGALGSGTSIGGGYIVTNAHVVTRPDNTIPHMIGILWDSSELTYAMGPIVAYRPDKDLAIVRADIGENRLLLPRVEVAKDPIRQGEPITVIGSPVGLIGNVTHGVVSYLNRGLSYNVGGVRTTFKQCLQVDAPINPGNSGGSLLNRYGELVGVPSAKLVHLAIEGLGFCVGIPDVMEVLEEAKLDDIPYFSRPDYESTPEGFNVSVKTHYMDLNRVTRIVLHHTGDQDRHGNSVHRDTSALEINRHHRLNNGWAGIGYHFVIRWDGLIEIGRSIYTQGAHTGGAINPISWGVVFSGNFNAGVPTTKQLDAWEWLHWHLESVNKRSYLVTGHKAHGNTDCPGINFPLASLLDRS